MIMVTRNIVPEITKQNTRIFIRLSIYTIIVLLALENYKDERCKSSDECPGKSNDVSPTEQKLNIAEQKYPWAYIER